MPHRIIPIIKNRALLIIRKIQKKSKNDFVPLLASFTCSGFCDKKIAIPGGSMIVEDYHHVPAEEVEMIGAENVVVRWLLGKDSPAPNFYLRLFEVQPGGHSPYHTHAMEHEIFILEGQGRINAKGKFFPVSAGSFALVEPNEEHQFENSGETVFKFLCVVPREKTIV
jgi:quercetin dioxygenase-like cupin family protein